MEIRRITQTFPKPCSPPKKRKKLTPSPSRGVGMMAPLQCKMLFINKKLRSLLRWSHKIIAIFPLLVFSPTWGRKIKCVNYKVSFGEGETPWFLRRPSPWSVAVFWASWVCSLVSWRWRCVRVQWLGGLAVWWWFGINGNPENLVIMNRGICPK